MSSAPTSKGRSPVNVELTTYELELMEKLFSNPRLWPDRAKVWIADYVSQNGLLPISQVQGFVQFVALQDTVETNESTTSTSYTNLATTGPEITGISPGQYLLFFGCQISPTPDDQGYAALSINGAAAGDSVAVVAGNTSAAGSGNIKQFAVARVGVQSFTSPNNSVLMKYRSLGGGSITFYQRWLVALRVGNP